MTPHLYCTYFDSAYLARGIAMLRSLRRHDPQARIFVVALDDLCRRALLARFGPRIRVIGTAPLHAAVAELRETQTARSPWAYYATQKPVVAQFAMEIHPRPQAVVYIDADTWFFSNPAPVFEEIADASVALSPHAFSPGLEHLETFGRFNAGFIYWRNDDIGRRCLSEWRDDCLAWCAEEPQPDGRFMNQGYLNRWPERYSGIHVIQHPGVNLAPWNADGRPLERLPVFFHFHGLERQPDGRWQSYFPHLQTRSAFASEIYLPYLAAVEAERRTLLADFGVEGTGEVRPSRNLPAALEFDLTHAPDATYSAESQPQ